MRKTGAEYQAAKEGRRKTEAAQARRLRVQAAEMEERAGRLASMIGTMEHERLRLLIEASRLRGKADG